MSFGSAMKELGYSENYALNPDQVKETDSWQKLMEEQIPDELLAQVHHGLLKHKEWRARDAGLDKAFKLKKRYDNALKITHELGRITDSELASEVSRAVSEIGILIAGAEAEGGEQ